MSNALIVLVTLGYKQIGHVSSALKTSSVLSISLRISLVSHKVTQQMPQLPLVGNCDWWRVVRAYHHPPPPTTTCHMVEGCPHLLCHVMWQKTYSKFTQVKFRPAAEDTALGSPSFQNIYESRVNERIVFRTVLWDISPCAKVNIFVKSKLAYWALPTFSY